MKQVYRGVVNAKLKTAYPPPYKKRVLKKICTIAGTAVLIAASLFSLSNLSVSQAANDPDGILRGDIYKNAPAQGIVFDTDAFAGKYQLTTKYSNIFQYETNWNGCVNALTMTLDKTPTPSSPATMTDPFQVKWSDVGHDKDGSRVDVVIKCHSLKAYYYQIRGMNLSPNKTHLFYAKDAIVCLQPWWNWYLSMDLSIYIYKTGTTTPAAGDLVMGAVDIDMPAYKTDGSYAASYTHEFAEHFELVSGYKTPIYITNNNYLSISKSNNTYKFMPTKADDQTYDSGFVVSLASSGARFKWAGCHTSGSDILKTFDSHKITASAGTGGSITDKGEKIIGYKNTPTYTATAASNYKIKSVTVQSIAANGTKTNIPVSVPANSKKFNYTFAPVTLDHTIDVQFEKIKTSISYDKNLAVATGSTAGTALDAGTTTVTAKNGFAAAGYTFDSWNTKADGTGTKYVEGTSITVGETPVVLYAQWIPIYYNIAASHEGEGHLLISGTDADGGNKVAWHNSITFDIEAEAGNTISRIEIDGVPIDLAVTEKDGKHTAQYEFSTVEADHSIHVIFEPIQVSVKWIDAFSGEEVTVYGLKWGETSPVPDIPTHQGRRFTYFSGDDWHHITEDRVIYINYTGYSYTVPSSGASKYNGFSFNYKK